MAGFQKRIISILLILSFCCSGSAVTLSVEDEAARDVALQWLRVVDSGNYEDAAAQMSQETRILQNWSNYFAAHRAQLGRVNNRKIAAVKHASTIPSDPEMRQHNSIRFKTLFEHKPAAVEEIVLTKMSFCWEVFEYKVE